MALDNFIPKNDMAECNLCRKFHKETITCEKYQEWIPRQKPVGHCEDYDPDEQKVKEKEEWLRNFKKEMAEKAAHFKAQKETDKGD